MRVGAVILCVVAGCQGTARSERPQTEVAPPAGARIDPAPAPPQRQRAPLELGIYEGVPWPVVVAPIDGPLPPAPTATEPPPDPPTPAGARVMAVVQGIRDSLRETSYQHATSVREADGVYNWDCSGMTSWILRRAAPTALRQLNSSRPVARDFAAAITRAPADRPRGGWQRIARVEDVMPGDVFAWRRPRGLPSKNTGHVGIVVDRPLAVPGLPGGWAVRIADSTSFGHQDDSRTDEPDGDGGFGTGTIAVVTDADGRAIQYGWFGTQSDLYVVTSIVFGRVSR